MGSKHMTQSFHWTAEYWRRKQYGLNRDDVVVCGTEVGRVKQVATAWISVPVVVVRFRDGHEESVPSESVTKL